MEQLLWVHVEAAYPFEAVGLMQEGGPIIALENHSESPGNSFEIHKEEIINAIEDYGFDPMAVVLWHSHPNGGVGPSTTDMRSKTPFNHHLVVTVDGGNLVYTWY